MTSVSMFEAKTNLSKYVASVVDHQEPYVGILRNGKPVAKIVPYYEESPKRIGIARGQLPMLPPLEEFNSPELTEDFSGTGGIE